MELQRSICNPNKENCDPYLNEEFKSYGVNNLGWSSLFKIVFPEAIASLMFWIHYRTHSITEWKGKQQSLFVIDSEEDQLPRERANDKYGHLVKEDKSTYGEFKDWWKLNGFTQHNWAWAQVAATWNFLWSAQFMLYLVWKFFDWVPNWQSFYIEHIVSNLNWFIYGYGLWQMLFAVMDENSWQSYLGLFVYLMLSWMFSFGEYWLGTDAIRYLEDQNEAAYYADPRLLPSLLYLFGLMEHEYKPDNQKFESDPTANQDIVIEPTNDDEELVDEPANPDELAEDEEPDNDTEFDSPA